MGHLVFQFFIKQLEAIEKQTARIESHFLEYVRCYSP